MKTTKIFMNGQRQTVRLPKEFRFDGSEVFIKRTGNIVHLIPRTGEWDVMQASGTSLPISLPSAVSQRRKKREGLR